MSSAAAGFRAKARLVRGFRETQLTAAGNRLRRDLIAAASSPTGGDLRLSGVQNGRKLGVQVRTTNGPTTTRVTITPAPKVTTAQWVWINTGTRAGRRGRRTTARAAGRMSYHHPGTRGSGAWDKTVNRALKDVSVELRAQFRTIISRG